MRNDAQALQLMRFFKTGKGSYGEGDRFLGLKVPQTRLVVKEARLDVSLPEIEKLLYSEWHEARLAGFLLIEQEMKESLPKRQDSPARCREKAERRDEIAAFYLRHARQSNNWDLVDIPCRGILGEWLLHPSADGTLPDRGILDRLAEISALRNFCSHIVGLHQIRAVIGDPGVHGVPVALQIPLQRRHNIHYFHLPIAM